MRCLTVALVAALATAAVAQEPTITKGPFQLYQVIENQTLHGDDNGRMKRVSFPRIPWGAPGYEAYYTALFATKVPDAKVGDVLDIRCTAMVLQEPFVDFRTGKAGSAFCPSELAVHTEKPPDDGRIHGERLWPGSGENVNANRPFFQIQKNAVHVVTKTPVWVVFYLGPASKGARDGQFLSVPTAARENGMVILHHRSKAPAKGADGGDKAGRGPITSR